jgi:prepilin-type N-terminal cleavage/methylation domain-containing protein
MTKTPQSSIQGFTLLELLLAISLMAILSITTTQMLRKTTTQTKKLTEGLDNINHLRSAVNIIKKDVNKAINFRDLNLFLYNEAQKERIARYDKRLQDWVNKYNKEKKINPPLTVQTITDVHRAEMPESLKQRPTKKDLKEEVIFTHFVGDKDKLYFTASSGVRFRSTDKISDLLEVGYFLKTCSSRRNPGRESNCLWRSVSYNVDLDITEGGTESVLIENIKSLEFKYLSSVDQNIDRDSVKWVDSWDSRAQGDPVTSGNFPAAVSVEVVLEIPNKRNKNKPRVEHLTGVFEVDFPNNQPFERIKNNANASADGTNPNGTNPGGGAQ